MRDTGVVVSVNDDCALVLISQNAACAGCYGCKRRKEIYALNPYGADIGDMVTIDINEGGGLKAAAVLYGLPCIVFIIGIFVGRLVASDFVSFLTGITLVGLYYLIIRLMFGVSAKEKMPCIKKTGRP